MKRFSYLAIIPILFFYGCAHRNPPEGVLTTINIIDRNGFSETLSAPERLTEFADVDFLSDQPYQKVLRVYSRDQIGAVRAYINSYHTNGQPQQYLEVVNGRANGLYQEWYPNGQMKLQVNVIGGIADLTPSAEKSWLFDGMSQVWSENGTLIAEIPYSRGVLDGVSLYYHSSGAIWKSVQFAGGKMCGVSEIFLENGDLFQRIHYVSGAKEGEAIRYWSKDKVASQEEYTHDLLITGRYYDLNGIEIAKIDSGLGMRPLFGKETITEMQEYKDGVPNGVVKVFGKNNIVLREYRIKNGVKHGEEVEYYPSSSVVKPQPKLSISWYEGLIQGVVKTWYPNGIQESQRELTGNTKNGVATAWYRDGSLMLIEEYDHDKLIKGEYYKKGEKSPVSEIKVGKGTATIYDADGNFLRKTPYLNSKPDDTIN